MIANLRTIGYRGPLSLELFNRSLWEQDPSTVIRRGIERIREPGRGLNGSPAPGGRQRAGTR